MEILVAILGIGYGMWTNGITDEVLVVSERWNRPPIGCRKKPKDISIH